MEFLDSGLFAYVILPLLIFLSRILDQSIGIMRLIFASKGYKKIVFMLGAFESLVWLLAISQIMQHLDNILSYIAFSVGFATGNFIGIYIEEKISIGLALIRVIPKKNTQNLVTDLRKKSFGVTTVNAEGKDGEIKIVFTTIKRRDIKTVISIIKHHNPTAFYTIEDVGAVSEGYFREHKKNTVFGFLNPFRRRREK